MYEIYEPKKEMKAPTPRCSCAGGPGSFSGAGVR